MFYFCAIKIVIIFLNYVWSCNGDHCLFSFVIGLPGNPGQPGAKGACVKTSVLMKQTIRSMFSCFLKSSIFSCIFCFIIGHYNYIGTTMHINVLISNLKTFTGETGEHGRVINAGKIKWRIKTHLTGHCALCAVLWTWIVSKSEVKNCLILQQVLAQWQSQDRLEAPVLLAQLAHQDSQVCS